MESYGWRRFEERSERGAGPAGRGGWDRWPHGSRARVRKSARFLRGTTAAAGAGAKSGPRAPEPSDDADLRRQRVEAVLLLSRAPVPSRKLAQLALLADATEARTLVRQLNQIYAERGRAFRAEEVAGGYQLMTRPQLAPWLRRLGHIPRAIQLTPPAMETMAIVAYRQPVLRADIEAIRGVACGEILRQLMERDLVRISGRSEELGRPYLYSTTKHFLQIFGLRGDDALPPLDENEIEISEHPDWSHANASTDPNPDHHPVIGVPEEESNVSTAVAHLVGTEPECDQDAYVGLSPLVSEAPHAVIDDEEEDAQFGIDDDFDDEDDDWDDEDDDEDDDVDDDEEEDADAEWEEVDDDDEWEDDDEEEDEVDAEEEDEVDVEIDEVDDVEDDEWDDEEDVVDDEEEEDEEWD